MSEKTIEFIRKATLIHSDKYDYSYVDYTNNHTKIKIRCKEHGEFEQTPGNHLQKKGCHKCGRNKTNISNRKLLNEFINTAKIVHGDKYDYSKVEYKNAISKIIIIWREHGEFEQTPDSHLHNHGCSKCFGNYNYNTEEWIKNAKIIHCDKYDYSKVIYKNTHSKIIIICREHGEFEQTPSSHIKNKSGCPICYGRNIVPTTKEWIEKAKIIHGDKYDYSKVNYIRSNNKVIINCKQHGEFEQTPGNHLQKKGCNKCNHCGYSKTQIIWLELISSTKNIYIQHAENQGEYKIPNTNFKADGYCEETNTIYEFHGDYWHGNPKRFNPTIINNTTHCTFGDLYQKTIDKEKKIKELGYNLISIWESDWIHFIRVIRKIQRKYREKNNSV